MDEERAILVSYRCALGRALFWQHQVHVKGVSIGDENERKGMSTVLQCIDVLWTGSHFSPVGYDWGVVLIMDLSSAISCSRGTSHDISADRTSSEGISLPHHGRSQISTVCTCLCHRVARAHVTHEDATDA